MFRKRSSRSVVSITSQELAEMDGADVFLVDTRPEVGQRIPGTDAHIPYDQVRKRTAELPADKGAAIAVYCVGGGYSSTAAKTLTKLGYTNVLHLKGGINAWKEAGHAIE